MSQFEDLEPHQYQNIYQEDDAPLVDVAKSSLRKVIYGAAGLFLFVVISGFVVSIPRLVKKEFVIKGGFTEQIYQYNESIYVLKKFVEVGDNINQGTPLLQITSEQIAQLLTSFETSRKKLEQFRSIGKEKSEQEKMIKQLEIQKIQQTISQKKTELSSLNRSSTISEERLLTQVELLKQKYERDSILFSDQSISTANWEESKANYKRVNAEYRLLIQENKQLLINLDNDLQNLRSDLSLTREEINGLDINYQFSEEALQVEMDQFQQLIVSTYGPFETSRNGIILLAERGGSVAFVNDSEKEILPNEEILKTKSSSVNFYAYSAFDPTEIGKITLGNETVLKFHTFPHYEWGTLNGAISKLSQTVDDSGSYPAQIDFVESGKLQGKIQKGMTGELFISIEEKNFFQYIFATVAKEFYEVTE